MNVIFDGRDHSEEESLLVSIMHDTGPACIRALVRGLQSYRAGRGSPPLVDALVNYKLYKNIRPLVLALSSLGWHPTRYRDRVVFARAREESADAASTGGDAVLSLIQILEGTRRGSHAEAAIQILEGTRRGSHAEAARIRKASRPKGRSRSHWHALEDIRG